MSRLLVDSIVSDAAATDLTLGASGDTVDITGDHISADTIKDSGGNTLFTSNGSGTLSSLQSEFSGKPVLITTNPDSTDVATISFTSSIDSTYKLYIFKFYDINPVTDNAHFTFQGNAASGSGYNETITSSCFISAHNEDDSSAEIDYQAGHDQAQGTSFQTVQGDVGNGGDESAAGTLWLFNPSNTTYVKHFYSRSHGYHGSNVAISYFVSGYFNTTSAIDDIQFKMSSGNMDGVIKMYGV